MSVYRAMLQQHFKKDAKYEVEIAGERVSATLKATIAEVEKTTRTVTAILALPHDSSVRAGDLGRLRLTHTYHAKGLWVPTAALSEGERGLWTVFAVVSPKENGSSEHRTVVQPRQVQGYSRGHRSNLCPRYDWRGRRARRCWLTPFGRESASRSYSNKRRLSHQRYVDDTFLQEPAPDIAGRDLDHDHGHPVLHVYRPSGRPYP